MDEVKRERIERLADEMDPTPDPGWEKMEQVAREHQQNQPAGQGQQADSVASRVVPESGDLTEPVGTESDSY